MLGVGIDVIEVERIARAVARWGDRFLNRILTAEELEVCRRRGHFDQSVAARFAAKEAFFKAIPGAGARALTWRDFSVLVTQEGRPIPVVSERARRLIGDHRVLVSLSHTERVATAVVVLD